MDKKLEEMSVEELKEYKENLEKAKLIREAKELEESQKLANEKAEADKVAKIKADAVEEFKKAQLVELANTNPGSVDAGEGSVGLQTSKQPVNLEMEIAGKRINNEFERQKEVLGLSANRKIEGLTYTEVVKRARSGYYKK